ncbi:hypothetical protein, partial [Methanosarcina spelaei]|uniref:hypothetical protein n=1 Tax=Methanosarcina spelaei TaxID=1036679 RepID=UPI001BAECA92
VNYSCIIREQDPLKQGLKLIMVNCCCWEFMIREQDPLKQGLKLKFDIRYIQTFYIIREQDPLKQGLKPENDS